MKSGNSKTGFLSSLGQFNFKPFATCIRVSKPTRSQVLNVADFGRPMIGPVSESTSATERFISFTM